MKRGLVLGGGGAVGVAWESGLCAGLRELGIDLAAADVVLGTSAGAIVGTRLLSGTPLTLQADRPFAFDRYDAEAIAGVFAAWRQMQEPTPPAIARIGAIARELLRDAEDAFVAHMAGLAGTRWPEGALRISAVDTASGERCFFDRDSGVPLARAVAASAAVPGLFPSVTIDGKRYMDGQVHSSTHLDALLADRPDQVVVLMPTNRLTARSIGGHAEWVAERERALLEAQGAQVLLCTPDAASAAKLGTNLMDPRNAPAAFAAGKAAAPAFAERLAG